MFRFIMVLGLLSVSTIEPCYAQSSVEFIRTNSVAFDVSSPLPEVIYPILADYKVLWLGEIHGTNESPAAVLKFAELIVNHGKDVFVALEIPRQDQDLVRQAVAMEDRELLKNVPFFRGPYHDGRSSEAMSNLLMSLHKFGQKVTVYCIDPAPADNDAQDRDTKMGRLLNDAVNENPSRVGIALTGNIHSRKTLGTPFDPNYRPAAYEALNAPDAPMKRRDLLPVMVRYLGGEAWVCMPEGESPAPVCGVHQFAEFHSNYTDAVTYNSYFLGDQANFDGHDATMFFKTFTASEPLVQ